MPVLALRHEPPDPVARRRVPRWVVGALVIAVVVTVGAIALLDSPPGESAGDPSVDDAPVYELTPFQATTLLVECLRDGGLPVTQEGARLSYDDGAVAPAQLEGASGRCRAQMERDGFRLPGDETDRLLAVYAQYQALAECYDAAGIEVSPAPPVEEFIADRRAGVRAWSPHGEAYRNAGLAAASEVEWTCALPSATGLSGS